MPAMSDMSPNLKIPWLAFVSPQWLGHASSPCRLSRTACPRPTSLLRQLRGRQYHCPLPLALSKSQLAIVIHTDSKTQSEFTKTVAFTQPLGTFLSFHIHHDKEVHQRDTRAFFCFLQHHDTFVHLHRRAVFIRPMNLQYLGLPQTSSRASNRPLSRKPSESSTRSASTAPQQQRPEDRPPPKRPPLNRHLSCRISKDDSRDPRP